ncbi:NapH/MauN family ferredoxin-type protein [Terasakiella sp. A23]|uniref:NapH/MauN family ferredoxin-type protein n=1 Tax=Terasakiella sp. FCG-A23 TaxID=3080561 RepID=UPI002952E0BE|nr:NapH/MauN family ferredoxin-type protein [Terasakiella sp. A23]MDV7341065.1 NapH/MauN family ferredoxin-type protein [Terasakiella sp. A23]
MKRFVSSLQLMLGKKPERPAKDTWTEGAKELHAYKKTAEQVKIRREAIKEEIASGHSSNKWKVRRWISIVVINLLFVLSFQFDIQMVEGALTASRFVGFHMADLNSALQVTLAYKHMVINLVIGTVTVFLLWWLLGGRTFCSWVCPYHLVSELAEMLHLKLVEKGLVKDHPLDRRLRSALYVMFALLAFVTGYTVFETISPVGILSRAFTYGATFALVWVGILFLIEVFYSRRFWCRYVCPIGLTYGFVGTVSPVHISYELENCLHEGECRKVCLVPHVLDITKMGYADDTKIEVGADCTRCGMCVDKCPTQALSFKVKGLDGML